MPTSLQVRLTELAETYFEDYGQELQLASVRTFLSFLALYPGLRLPCLTATPEGELFAEWSAGADALRVAIQFRPLGQLICLLTSSEGDRRGGMAQVQEAKLLCEGDAGLLAAYLTNFDEKAHEKSD